MSTFLRDIVSTTSLTLPFSVHIKSDHPEISQILAGFAAMAGPCPPHLRGGQAGDATNRNLFSDSVA